LNQAAKVKPLGRASQEVIVFVQTAGDKVSIQPFVKREIKSLLIDMKRVKALLRAEFGGARATEKDCLVIGVWAKHRLAKSRYPKFLMVVPEQDEMHAGPYAIAHKLITVLHQSGRAAVEWVVMQQRDGAVAICVGIG
jgi:hypothetical protein